MSAFMDNSGIGATMSINKKEDIKSLGYFLGDDSERINAIVNMNNGLNKQIFYDMQFNTVIGEIEDDYLEKKLITAEECAKQMQERAEIYFGE